MNFPSAQAQSSPGAARGGPRSLRIVLADDDRDTVEMLAIVLRDEGHVVHGVYTGKEVLPIVRAVNPDAVILDISVPGLSGYAIAQEIRFSFTDARCPLLIAMSGKWKDFPDRRVARQVGFDAHLLKPCDTDELLALLRPLAGRK